MANSLLNSRKSCTILCAGFFIFILAADICLAGHTKNIMLTGYWPPTNEMLRKFSTNPSQNPDGWQGENWEGRGYDIYAYFPEFPGGKDSNPKGNGDLEIDYQDVGSWSPPANPTGDFWRITSQVHPVAIMSYGAGAGPWEIEYNARNLPSSSWSSDYLAPTKPTPAPPDTGQSSGYVRHSSLPMEAIAEAVNSSGLSLTAWVDWDGNPGAFLCEYMAYHDGWYQSLHSDPCDPYYCVAAGFTHLANGTGVSTATAAAEAALRATINYLDSQLIHYTISGTATFGGSPLAGVTMCGLPGNPVTNSSGAYSAQIGGGWSGVVTPLKSGYAFNPFQRTYSNARDNQSAQDYTASAATAETIQLDAASSNSSSTASTTLSWSHTVASGNNRLLVVGVVCEDSTPADQIISSVKFNGVNMTPVPGSTKSRGNSSSTLRADLYYMLNPPAGAYMVLITYNGTVSYRAGGAISLRNVKQQAPETVVTNSISSATSISTSITVPNNGAWIVDVVGHSNSGSFTTSTSTKRWDKGTSYHEGAGSTKAVTSPGSNTTSWSFSGSSGTIVHSLAAFAPSEAIPSPPGKATNPNPPNSATGVSITTDLGWSAGSGVTSHDVYFGTSSPGTFQGNQTATTFDTGTMSYGTTYYWRIDEKNAEGTTTGDVWSFTTVSAPPEYALTINTVGSGTVTKSPDKATYNPGEVVTLTANPATGWSFSSWSGDLSGSTNPTTITMNSNRTVTATFTQNQYTLTINTVGSGSVAKSPDKTTYTYGEVVTLTANPALGWSFGSWSGDLGGSTNPETITITGNKTVTATFTQNQYTLTINTVGSGSVAKSPDKTTYTYGEVVTLTANPALGWSFSSWSGDLTGSANPTTITMTGNKTVTATFTQNQYTLTINTVGSGSVAKSPDKTTYTYGEVVTLTANPALGWSFSAWSGDLTGSANPTTITMTGNKTVTANFTIDQRTIFGYVLEPDANIPVEGVFINANNGGGSDTTDVNGYYQLTVDYGWPGTVDPNKTGYTFEPNGIEYSNVTTNQNDNYTAILDTFIISGYAVDSEMLTPLEGVLVSPDNDGGPYTSKYYGGGHDTTDANGYYRVLVDYNWSGKVVPSKYAYAFQPSSITYANVTEEKAEEQDYVGTLLTYIITGYIKNSCEVPIEGVLVDANNGGCSDTSDPNGYYEVWVDYNWSGTLTPAKENYTFSPTSMFYLNILDDVIDHNYTATNIYDLDCDGSIGLGDVAIISENWLETGPDIPGDFHKDENNTVNFLDFAEFGLSW